MERRDEGVAAVAGPTRRHPFAAVNLISDPIHGYLELSKRLTPDASAAAGLPVEDVAEEDLLDTAWLQRLRRISQLQSARWVFPTAEHSRFTHGLGVMHEAGLWARSLYPSLRAALLAAGERPVPSEGLVVETLRVAGLLHDVGHGPFAHFFDDHVLAAFSSPADPRRDGPKALTHEDLSQRIIEDELGSLIGGLRRAPGAVPERDALADDERIDPRWVSFLVSKPALADPSMPRWVRWLQPLLSGVFTVDNIDYVRRDAYLIGVATGPVDIERPPPLHVRRRARPDALRAGDRRARDVPHGPVVSSTSRSISTGRFARSTSTCATCSDRRSGRSSATAHRPNGCPPTPTSTSTPCSTRPPAGRAASRSPGRVTARPSRAMDGSRRQSPRRGRRSCCAARTGVPTRSSVRSTRRASDPRAGSRALGRPEPGRIEIDLAEVDARPADATAGDSLLAVEGGTADPGMPVSQALRRMPAYALIARRYRRHDRAR